MAEDKKIIPEVKKVEESSTLAKGMVEFAVMDGDKEVSLHVTSLRTFEKTYANNPKYKLKKKAVK